MCETIELLIHYFVTLIKLLKPGGVKLLMAETILMKQQLIIMNQFTRRIIGFAVHAGDCDGVSYCRMFNEIISDKAPPKYLSSDNDPLFLFQRWCANRRVIEIDEITLQRLVSITGCCID